MKPIIYFDFWGTLYDGQRIVDGASTLLKDLAPTHTMVIVSSADTHHVRRILESAGIVELFLHVIGGDTGGSKAEKMLQIGTDNAAMITDTVHDIREAKQAGVKAIGVTWGADTAEDLLTAGADAIAANMDDLKALLAK